MGSLIDPWKPQISGVLYGKSSQIENLEYFLERQAIEEKFNDWFGIKELNGDTISGLERW